MGIRASGQREGGREEKTEKDTDGQKVMEAQRNGRRETERIKYGK